MSNGSGSSSQNGWQFVDDLRGVVLHGGTLQRRSGILAVDAMDPQNRLGRGGTGVAMEPGARACR